MEQKKKILVTGAHGKLGKALMAEFVGAATPARDVLDVTDRHGVDKFIELLKPDIVIHAAALVDVARCEREKELAWKTNVGGTENLVEAVSESNPDAYFVYISTACVFRGDRGDYAEEDVPQPVNMYGLTKLVGEFVAKRLRNNLIIRTNFVAQEPWKHERAFVDRYGTYLFAHDVARGVKEVIDQNLNGIVHICGDKKMSMLELAKLVSPDIKPLTLSEFAKNTALHLTQDMTLRSVKIPPYRITLR